MDIVQVFVRGSVHIHGIERPRARGGVNALHLDLRFSCYVLHNTFGVSQGHSVRIDSLNVERRGSSLR